MATNEKKYKAGAALCPSCASVIEYYYENCPWCNHEIVGQEAMKVYSMLSETGVPAEDLRAQLKDAGRKKGESMLPFVVDNFEKGSQGAKMASLLVLQAYGDPGQLKIATLEEGFKKSSNPVKIEIVNSLAQADMKEAGEALGRLREYENDPEVLLAFPKRTDGEELSEPPSEEFSTEELSPEDFVEVEEDKADKKPPLPPTGKKAAPPVEGKGPPPPPRLSTIPSAEDILPPMPQLEKRTSDEETVPAGHLPHSRKSRALPIILVGIGFVITGALVLVLLVVFDIKIPMGKKTKAKVQDLTHQVTGKGPSKGSPEKGGEGASKKPEKETGKPEAGEQPVKKEGEGTEAGETEAEGEETTEGEEAEAGVPEGPVKAAGPGQLGFTISASSQHKKYPASNMIDGDPKTVWQEDRLEKPYDHVITLDFGKDVTVTSMSFITGFDDPDGEKGDMFPINNRLKKAKVTFSDGTEKEFVFEDKREKQTMKVEPPVKARKAEITVLEVYRGSWFFDNAVAEIEVGGRE
jgi:hypothetical protein